MKFITVTDQNKQQYESFVNNNEMATCMQMWQWTEFRNKITKGLYDRVGVVDSKGEFVLTATYAINKFSSLGNVLYIPQGPIWKDSSALEIFVSGVKEVAKEKNCFALICDPRVEKESSKFEELTKAGFEFTDKAVQPRVTVFLDLERGEDEILSSFSKTTRYNINYAKRKGVTVTKYDSTQDVERIVSFYELLLKTQKRKYFYVQPLEYFEHLWEEFSKDKRITLYEARFQDEHLGSILVLNTDKWAASLFSASSSKFSKLKPLYLTRWESIMGAKNKGCKVYDFFGATKSKDESHPFYFTTQHKLGFSKDLRGFAGTFEIILNPIKYKVWTFLEKLNLFKFYEESFIKEFKHANK